MSFRATVVSKCREYPDQIDVRLTSATAFCRLRKGPQRVLKRLSHCTGRDWRPVCEVSNMEALCATVEADLAVVPLLASTVPNLLDPIMARPQDRGTVAKAHLIAPRW
jgi:DNA-binding transcriptional LysR family regulator